MGPYMANFGHLRKIEILRKSRISSIVDIWRASEISRGSVKIYFSNTLRNSGHIHNLSFAHISHGYCCIDSKVSVAKTAIFATETRK